jgi:hypothetical protein
MRERHERIVVNLHARTPPIQLGIDSRHGSKQLKGLIDEVTADVIQQPTRLFGSAALTPSRSWLGTPAFESRLEANGRTELILAQQLAHRQEVSIPSPVVKDRERQAALLRVRDELPRLRGACRERLVDDHGTSGIERRARERNMRAVGRGDDDQVEIAAFPQLVGVCNHARVRMIASRLVLALRLTGHDRGQPQAGGRDNQRRVENSTSQTVPDQSDAYLGALISNAHVIQKVSARRQR